MNIGSLFLSLGIKGDTKSLDDAIKKVEELKKQTQELNKALKETKTNSKFDLSASSTKNPSKFVNPELLALKEKASFSQENLKLARAEMGLEKLKNSEEEKERKKREKEQKRLEREEKKREKEREKATKDFFSQIENGFSFIAKAFTGGLVAGGIGGYVVSQAAKQTALTNSLKQYGIDPEKSQRYANVFRKASYGRVGLAETNDFVSNLANRIASGLTTDPALMAQFGVMGIDPSNISNFDDAIKQIRQYSKNPNYRAAELTSLLEKLGVPNQFAPAFGKDFSDEQFSGAYNNAKILSNQQVQSGADINLRIAELGNAFDVLKGVLLDNFAPAILGLTNKIEKNLTPENIEAGADIAKGIGAGYATTKALKYLTKYGKAGVGRLGVAGAGGLSLYQGLSYLAEENERLYFPKKYKKKMAAKNNGNDKGEYIADFGEQGFDTVDDSFYRRDPNGKPSARDIENFTRQTMINPTNNVSITTNINAASVDRNAAPLITNGINDNINSVLLNSKYPTIGVAK
jgi:hypothetical protein